MSFVGVISDKDDFKFIENEMFKNYPNLQLIGINKNNIDNMKNIKFETIIICCNINNMENKKVTLDAIIENAQYLVINGDLNTQTKIFNKNEIETITYGMNQKSMVTASSIKEDEVLIGFQRNIENIKGNIIEVQELKIKTEDITNNKVYNLLTTVALKKLYE